MDSALLVRDGVEKRAEYSYDAFGNRTGQDLYSRRTGSGIPDTGREILQDPEQQIRYTIDLTRQYHNLLVSKDHARQKEQTFYWDGNVAAMEEDGTYSSYLQDDLGSPMHLLDENGEIRESYGYDEFGMPLESFPEQSLQPFGFTGYQKEEAGGLYFAQARRYDAGAGRFVSEDKIRGHIASPYTLNPYNYCLNRPLNLIDLNGLSSQVPDVLIEGNEAHRLLQAKFMLEISGGQVEYQVTSGIDSNKSGTGRADIVYFNSATKTVEVYEIKPGSYSPGAVNYKAGQEQLNGYIKALNKNGQIINGWKAKKGVSLNEYFNSIVIPSVEYPDKEIVYKVYENGLINYYYRDKQEQEEPATVPETEEAKEKDYSAVARVGFGALGVVTSIAALVLYADDILGGAGVVDDGVATGLGAYAAACFIIAFTGKKKQDACDMS